MTSLYDTVPYHIFSGTNNISMTIDYHSNQKSLTKPKKMGKNNVMIAVLEVTSVTAATSNTTSITITQPGRSPNTVSCFPISNDNPDCCKIVIQQSKKHNVSMTYIISQFGL